ncbi:MAG: hypothetical protein GX587_11735 [Bacteroidales bacterium]|nr:hypothetical protein [Bacteroidales bacterium]
MKLEDFLLTYGFKFHVENFSNVKRIIYTQVFRKDDGTIVDGIKSTLELNEVNDWDLKNRNPKSLWPIDWSGMIEKEKRLHLDYFVHRIKLVDFKPLKSTFDIKQFE